MGGGTLKRGTAEPLPEMKTRDDEPGPTGATDPLTGLPTELGIDEDLETQGVRLTVSLETRRYGKAMTVVSGFDDEELAKKTAKELKRALATGGSAKRGRVELQGDHADRVSKHLEDKGYLVG